MKKSKVSLRRPKDSSFGNGESCGGTQVVMNRNKISAVPTNRRALDLEAAARDRKTETAREFGRDPSEMGGMGVWMYVFSIALTSVPSSQMVFAIVNECRESRATTSNSCIWDSGGIEGSSISFET